MGAGGKKGGGERGRGLQDRFRTYRIVLLKFTAFVRLVMRHPSTIMHPYKPLATIIRPRTGVLTVLLLIEDFDGTVRVRA